MSAEVEEVLQGWTEAIRQSDVSAAAGFLADDFVLSSTGGVASNLPREQWLATLPQIETRALSSDDVQARVFGDVAVVRHRLAWDARFGDRDLSGAYAVTDVFSRAGGTWLASWRISTRLSGEDD